MNWLEQRKKIIGGSDISAIIGLNPWKTNQDVWREKALGGDSKISNNEAMEYGKKAERPLMTLFALDHPQYILKPGGENIIRHPKYPFIGGTLDAELVEKETGAKGVLEIKTTTILNSMAREKWKGKLPDNYYSQTCWYLLVTGYEFAILKAQLKTVYDDGIRLQTNHYHIKREEVLNDLEYLEKEAVNFWNKYVIPKIIPPLRLPEI